MIDYKINNQFKPGITFCEKNVLSLAIMLMGAQLNYSIISTLNYHTAIIILTLIIVAIISSYFLGKIFKLYFN